MNETVNTLDSFKFINKNDSKNPPNLPPAPLKKTRFLFNYIIEETNQTKAQKLFTMYQIIGSGKAFDLQKR